MAYGTFPQELMDIIPYFLLAQSFGWTKEQVDSQPAEHIEKMLLLVKGLYESMGRESKDLGRKMRRGGMK